ncbi:CAP and S-layer homology domain-containing protein [Ureibacillus manganicus]|uniref:CAP and S-layer homology domain-containing protein n=1 Tax=Ureibacillus manganicus TaxID=1266064 RepID=UPI00068FD415|nr:CAP domain-containing protein [Ureibacillus manganicus]
MLNKMGLVLLILLFIVIQTSTISAFAKMETVPYGSQDTMSIKIEKIKDSPHTMLDMSSILRIVNHGSWESSHEHGKDGIVQRGEAAKIITMALSISLDSDYQLKAIDVPMTHKYYKEIRKLAELGIIQNVEYIRPDEPLKRSEASVMIARSFDVQIDQQNQKKFTDYDAKFWAKDFIESLADVYIIFGTSATTFSPNQNVTTSQLAALISRGQEFEEQVNNLEIVYDYLAKDYIYTKNYYTNLTDEVISFVNFEREKAGMKPLIQDKLLNQLAIIKAQDMIDRDYFEHRSPFYGYPWDLATLFDYGYTNFGENIARNYHSPKDVVEAWMASPSHKENILRNNYTNIGVGVREDDDGNYYWVQMFSRM